MEWLSRLFGRSGSKEESGPLVVEWEAEEVLVRLKREPRPVLVDVREHHEYAAIHIPGAKLIPLGKLESRLKELPKDRDLVLVCRSGHRSGQACRVLTGHGYTRIASLKGGMQKWTGKVARRG